jgi:excinuclease ABC subunit C
MIEREMKRASKEERFEDAARLRNRLYALMHIQDVSVIQPDDPLEAARREAINVFGRVEAYDISNIGGKEAVGSMVALVEGRPNKNFYKRFQIRTVEGSNDVAMMKEVLLRRFERAKLEKGPSWKLPDLIVIDGGRGQVNAAAEAMETAGLGIPFVGLAKGFDRKQDVLIYPKPNAFSSWKLHELQRAAARYKKVLQHARDEAHRFAVSYHRKRRGMSFRQRLGSEN